MQVIQITDSFPHELGNTICCLKNIFTKFIFLKAIFGATLLSTPPSLGSKNLINPVLPLQMQILLTVESSAPFSSKIGYMNEGPKQSLVGGKAFC